MLGGVPISPAWLVPTLMAALLIAVAVGDHPRLFANYRVQIMKLDAAYTDEAALTSRLEHMLGAKVHRVAVRRVDLIEDTTDVEVRFAVLHRRSTPQVDARQALLREPGGGR